MSAHRRCWKLLPWYVNGTLDAGEQREVEEHLESCSECRGEIERCRLLEEFYGAMEPSAPAPHPARVERLWARAREAEDRRRSTLPWRPIALAQAALIAVGLGILGWQAGHAPSARRVPTTPPAFHTLAAPQAPASVSRVARFRVVFAPETPEAEIRRIVLSFDGEVVGGPTPLGVYTVAIPRRDALEAWTEVVTSRLRGEAAVRFAEPVSGPEGEERR
jgi:anti-sigma-K factor RskA